MELLLAQRELTPMTAVILAMRVGTQLYAQALSGWQHANERLAAALASEDDLRHRFEEVSAELARLKEAHDGTFFDRCCQIAQQCRY